MREYFYVIRAIHQMSPNTINAAVPAKSRAYPLVELGRMTSKTRRENGHNMTTCSTDLTLISSTKLEKNEKLSTK